MEEMDKVENDEIVISTLNGLPRVWDVLHRNPTLLRRGKDLNPLSVGLGQLELGSTVTIDQSSSVLALKLNRAKEGFPKKIDALKAKQD